MKKYLSVILCLSFLPAMSQSIKPDRRLLLGSFHRHHHKITGISYGLWSGSRKPRNTTTSGLRLEILGEGIILPLLPGDPLATNDSEFIAVMHDTASEKIRGINLSATGSWCDCNITGISMGIIGEIFTKVRGISAAFFINAAQEHSGIQLALFATDAYKMSGLQVGLFNNSQKTRGIQIGLWNRNERRALPLINWNFSRKNKNGQRA